MKLFCKCYGREFEASTMQAAKRTASRIANGHYKAVDVLHVVEVVSGLSASSALVTYLEYHNKNLTKTQYYLFQDLLNAIKAYDFTKPIDY